jgi:RNA polymerase sigma-70 factor (ECF subfamily)
VESPAPPAEPDDLALVDAANRGDAGAFERLYRRHRDWTVRLAFRFTRDRDLALDVLQETFVYLLSKFPGFALRARLTTFLYPVVRHLAIEARRKSSRAAPAGDGLPDLPAPPPAPDGIAHPALARALETLPEAQRETLLMRFVDGMALDEIALALRIPLGTVKSRLHHALSALKGDVNLKNLFDE